MDVRAIVITAIIGVVAGWLASLVMGGGGFLRYLVTGIIGSFVGAIAVNALGVNLKLGHPIVDQIVVAAIGAVIVIAVARLIA